MKERYTICEDTGVDYIEMEHDIAEVLYTAAQKYARTQLEETLATIHSSGISQETSDVFRCFSTTAMA